jgi:hypothetical protein
LIFGTRLVERRPLAEVAEAQAGTDADGVLHGHAAGHVQLGRENADKCAWTFGTEYTVSNGSKANLKLGTRDYLIQQNWVNASGGYCAMSY